VCDVSYWREILSFIFVTVDCVVSKSVCLLFVEWDQIVTRGSTQVLNFTVTT